MLFLLINYFIAVREYIASFGDVTKQEHARWALDLMKYCEWALGWSQQSTPIHVKTPNRILFLSNHQNMCDFAHVQYYLFKHFPQHRILFIMHKRYKDMPLFDKGIRKHILLEGTYETDQHEISTKLDQYKHENLVVVLFPEGKIYHDTNITKSIQWCETNNIKPYTTTLCPRVKGIRLVVDQLDPTCILQNHIVYGDDIHHTKGTEYMHFVNGNLPRHAEMTIKDVTYIKDYFKKEPCEDLFYEYWHTVDVEVTKQYNQFKEMHEQFHKNKHIFHDYMVEKNHVNWVSSKYMVLLLPIGFANHGILFGLLSCILLFTSYNYHVYRKNKLFDMTIAFSIILSSYYLSKHRITHIYLAITCLLYILNKAQEYLFQTHDTHMSVFLHSTLHAIGVNHILVEFLLNFLI